MFCASDVFFNPAEIFSPKKGVKGSDQKGVSGFFERKMTHKPHSMILTWLQILNQCEIAFSLRVSAIFIDLLRDFL
jgi:hypothetical protein